MYHIAMEQRLRNRAKSASDQSNKFFITEASMFVQNDLFILGFKNSIENCEPEICLIYTRQQTT